MPERANDPPSISDAEMFQAMLTIAWFGGDVRICTIGTHGAAPAVCITGEEPFLADWPADRQRLIDYAEGVRR